MKWTLVVAIGCVNIAVFYIWTTAQMPSATPYQVMVNHMFEKAEKSFFLVIDLALNLYFLYLVRFRLIADGLSKYWRLFNFNAGIVVVSTSMDVLLLGFLSLPDPYLYGFDGGNCTLMTPQQLANLARADTSNSPLSHTLSSCTSSCSWPV